MLVNFEAGAVETALTFYIRDICAESGISELQSATLLSIMALVGFPVTIITGFMLEKMAVHYILAGSFLI